MNRRELITGLVSFVMAPAVVRASSLMIGHGERYFLWKYSLPLLPDPFGPLSFEKYLGPNGNLYKGTWTFFGKTKNIYSDEQINFRKEEYSY